jgi:hypothetical protein
MPDYRLRFPAALSDGQDDDTREFAAACPACGHPVDIQQPDSDLPDRLLGICFRCRSWFLIHVGGEGEMILTGLPGGQTGAS